MRRQQNLPVARYNTFGFPFIFDFPERFIAVNRRVHNPRPNAINVR